jgi:hypothetical protein
MLPLMTGLCRSGPVGRPHAHRSHRHRADRAAERVSAEVSCVIAGHSAFDRLAEDVGTRRRACGHELTISLQARGRPPVRRTARAPARHYLVLPSCTSPRQAPVSSPRLSISCLNRSRSPCT